MLPAYIMEDFDITITGDAGQKAEKQPLDTKTVDFSQPDILVAQLLDGRFLIQKNLTDDGADVGGMGVVYLARDQKLMGKLVVVKILKEAALKHGDIIRKFLHEKEALIRLDHPGIVRILDSGNLSDGNPFMVMEFIEGHSLRKEMLNKARMPFTDVADIIESVTDALSAAHSKDILHRDVKPENIMLTPQDDGPARVRLIDFGIARVGESQLAPATEIPRSIGTILYIAPEQLIGRLDLTPAADIFATAIIAYEMLTGQMPFNPKSPTDMYVIEQEGLQTRPCMLRPDLPSEAEGLLISALSFEPERRPQNAREFGRNLATALRSAPVSFDNSEKYDFSDLHTIQIAKADLTDFNTVNRGTPDDQEISNVDVKKPGSIMKWVVFAVLALGVVSLPVGYFALKALSTGTVANLSNQGTANKPKTNSTDAVVAADSGTERELSFFLMIQKMRNGKAFEDPFKSEGQHIYGSGDKFTITFQSEAEGYTYIYNEGNDADGNVGYYLLFPSPSSNGGSSQVAAGQPIQTAQNKFGGGKGTEKMWVIWTSEKRDDLEAITAAAAKANQGEVKDVSNIATLKNFFEKYKSENTVPTKDNINQRTVIKGKGDIIVHRFELEHQ